MNIQNLLDDVEESGAGDPVQIPTDRIDKGSIPIHLFSTDDAFVATVVLEGTIATPDQVTAETCTWTPLSGASWSGDICDALFVAFTHVRANVTAYTSGGINMNIVV